MRQSRVVVCISPLVWSSVARRQSSTENWESSWCQLCRRRSWHHDDCQFSVDEHQLRITWKDVSVGWLSFWHLVTWILYGGVLSVDIVFKVNILIKLMRIVVFCTQFWVGRFILELILAPNKPAHRNQAQNTSGLESLSEIHVKIHVS